MSTFKRKEPVWREWKLPQLRVPVIQANGDGVQGLFHTGCRNGSDFSGLAEDFLQI